MMGGKSFSSDAMSLCRVPLTSTSRTWNLQPPCHSFEDCQQSTLIFFISSILAPADVPPAAAALLPMNPSTARAIATRLRRAASALSCLPI